MNKIAITGLGRANSVDVQELQQDVSPKILRRMPDYVRLGLLAAVRALKSAGKFPPPPAASLCIGSHYGCQQMSFDFMDSIIADGAALSSPMAFSHSVNNVAVALMSIALKTEGPSFTFNTQDRSFESALISGHTLLANNRCELALVGLVDECDNRLDMVFPLTQKNASSFFLVLEPC